MKQIFTILLASMILVQFSAAQDITAFPYFTGFEGVEGTLNENYPSGWTSEDLNVQQFGNQTWEIIKNSTTVVNANTDSTAIHMFSHAGETNNDWLYTPSIQMSVGNTYRLKFWYKVDTYGGVTSEKMKIHVANANSAASMEINTALWDENNITNIEYQEAILEYIPEVSGTFYFGFHYYSDEFMYLLFVDDVTIEEESSTFAASLVLDNNFEILYSELANEIEVQFESVIKTVQEIKLYNLCGQLVKSKTINSGSNKVNFITSDLNKGIYIINVISDDNKQISKKFVVR